MNYVEHPLSFECAGEKLLGIVSAPSADQAKAGTGVIIIVGGPQYRLGSHRQFALLARALAGKGFPVLRFDYRGMGDSTGALRNFEHISDDIAAAINALQSATGVKNIVLWGLCDAASASLLYCQRTQDARVIGVCLLNPWVRTEAGLARTHIKHYYRHRLLQADFWLKLLRGEVAWPALKGLGKNLLLMLKVAKTTSTNTRTYQEKMAEGWARFNGSILLILSGSDLTAREFVDHAAASPDWRGSLQKDRVHRHDIAGADHTFSSISARKLVEDLTSNWLNNLP